MNITINGKTMTIAGDCTNISVKNGKIIVNGKEAEDSIDVVDIHVDGNVGSVKCNGSVDVSGNVEKGVDCGGDISCQDIGGSVDAGGSVACQDVGGSVDAGGSVNCETVYGDVDAGGSIKMKK